MPVTGIISSDFSNRPLAEFLQAATDTFKFANKIRIERKNISEKYLFAIRLIYDIQFKGSKYIEFTEKLL